MGFSDYLERGILKELFGVDDNCPPKWVKPSKYYVALCKQEVNDDDTGCTIKEPPTATGYERVENRFWSFAQLDLGGDYFVPGELAPNKLSITPTEQCPCDSAESTEVQNNQEVIFPKSKSAWGEIVYVAILDSKIHGNLLAYGKLAEPVSIDRDEIFKFDIGDLIIGIQGGMDNTTAPRQAAIEIKSKQVIRATITLTGTSSSSSSSSSSMSSSSTSNSPTPEPTATPSPTPAPTPTPTDGGGSGILFDSSSWASVVPEPYKTYLDQAKSRWEQFVKYDPAAITGIQQLTPGWSGLKLANYTEQNVNESWIASCGPENYVDLVEGSSGLKFASVSFNLNVNKFYESTLNASDWVNVLTHELGHALGIGIYWNSALQPLGAVPPSNDFLDGTAYTEAQSAYNAITESLRTKIPLESSGGAGTQSAHWEDNYRNNSAPGSGGVDHYGLTNELMNGSYAPGSTIILSDVSIKCLVDFGYQEVNPGSNEGVPTIDSSGIVIASNKIKLVCGGLNKLRKLGKVNLITGQAFRS